MHYRVVLFGVKDTSADMIAFLQEKTRGIDLIVTIAPSVLDRNHVSGYSGLRPVGEKYGIPVHEAESYYLTDVQTETLFSGNTFDIGIVMGWQRLIPKSVLDAFSCGVFGFHGNSGFLPFGRGRSPLNWSVILGDTRFNLNLFRYDEKADSPNVFATKTFQITPHDDIRTCQYKNQICSRALALELLGAYERYLGDGTPIPVRTDSRDFDSWYPKRTPADGEIDWHARTRQIYDLIRGVTAPFPGAFCTARTPEDGPGGDAFRVLVWEAHPFDEFLDLHEYAPGEIFAVFDGKPLVRTVDGSMIIDRYEADTALREGMCLGGAGAAGEDVSGGAAT